MALESILQFPFHLLTSLLFCSKISLICRSLRVWRSNFKIWEVACSTKGFLHSYKNRTGTGKTGRFDRFQTQTGSNRPLKPLQTGSVRNRFFFANEAACGKVRDFLIFKKKLGLGACMGSF
jgi:hypothetical protein